MSPCRTASPLAVRYLHYRGYRLAPASRGRRRAKRRQVRAGSPREVSMSTPWPLFATTVIGSMPRPQFVRDLLAGGQRTAAPSAEWQRRMDAAVAYVIALQEEAGIDVVSDGEWRRASYVDV